MKRKTAKKATRTRKKTHKKKFKILNLLILMAFISITATVLAYIFLLENTNKTKMEPSKKIVKKYSNINHDDLELEKYRKERLKKYLDKQILLNKEFEEISNDSYKEYDSIEEIVKPIKKIPKELIKQITKENNKHKITPVKKSIKNDKNKLIIVIDDVSSLSQVSSILKLNEKITMSFLPPTKNHKNSAKIALNLPFYMIHIPLQASSAFKFQEQQTLNITDSYEKIDKYVRKIREWYPNGKYINNHTGSKFTSNEKAMDNLYKALKKYDFIFIDSRTTAKSVAKKYAKKYNMPYLARNVFLDNEQNFEYIQNQLKKAIKIAHKNGSALAIGHPYDITIKVLRESKYLFKDLELIYLNQSKKL